MIFSSEKTARGGGANMESFFLEKFDCGGEANMEKNRDGGRASRRGRDMENFFSEKFDRGGGRRIRITYPRRSLPAAGAGNTENFSSENFATPPPGLFSTSLSISHTFPRCFFAHRLEIECIMAPPKKKQKASNTSRVSLSPNNDRGRPNKNNRRSARDQPQPDSQPVIPVRHPEAYVESTILLSDEIFATACPKEWEGHLFRYCVASYNSATELFSLKYEKQTILSDGVSFLSDDDGDVEIMENIKLETIQLGMVLVCLMLVMSI